MFQCLGNNVVNGIQRKDFDILTQLGGPLQNAFYNIGIVGGTAAPVAKPAATAISVPE